MSASSESDKMSWVTGGDRQLSCLAITEEALRRGPRIFAAPPRPETRGPKRGGMQHAWGPRQHQSGAPPGGWGHCLNRIRTPAAQCRYLNPELSLTGRVSRFHFWGHSCNTRVRRTPLRQKWGVFIGGFGRPPSRRVLPLPIVGRLGKRQQSSYLFGYVRASVAC